MKYISLIAVLFLTTSLTAQNTVKMSAVKGNDYGVAYALPKTSIDVTVSYTKTIYKAGQFYQYAERYLNVSNPIVEDAAIYKLGNIESSTKGVIDKGTSYLVEFKTNTTAPFVTLSKDGLICAINTDYTFDATAEASNKAKDTAPTTQLLDPNSLLSEEILRAGSTAKQAELIAKQIYRLRESRTNILTGEADNMPPDGNAYKLVMAQLEEQEKALSALFVGSESIETGSKSFTFTPGKEEIERQIIFRFSSKLGVVEANDLSGAPVYMTLENKNPRPEVFLSAKEEKELEKKFSKGIIYNIPGKATLQIVYSNKNYVNKEIDIVQYGTQDVLAPQMFDNNKRPIQVIFYPESGAIKQIIQ